MIHGPGAHLMGIVSSRAARGAFEKSVLQLGRTRERRTGWGIVHPFLGSRSCSWRPRMSLDIFEEQEPGAYPRPRVRSTAWIGHPRDYRTGWAIGWTVLLLAMILAPQRVLPDENSISLKRYIPYCDLAVHLTLFAGFVLTWLRVVRSPYCWVWIAAIGFLLAVSTEYAQGLPFIHRDPNLLDGLADAVGVLVGLIGSAFLYPSRAPCEAHPRVVFPSSKACPSRESLPSDDSQTECSSGIAPHCDGSRRRFF
jgi:hypothetical protein